MTFAMAVHIIFPAIRDRKEIELRRASELKIESTWKEFTDRAEIKLPRNIRIFNGMGYSDIFHIGDPVEIRLGYGTGELPIEFIGYISDISEGVPVVIRCEDEMFKLKRGNVSVVSEAITLRNLLERIAPGYEIDCPDVNLGAVRFANVAPIAVLEQIRKDTGLFSYFDRKILRVGVIYGDQSGVPVVNIHLEKNAVSERLNRKSGTQDVEIRAISILNNGRRIAATVGTRGGTSVQRTYIGITVQAELEKRAKADLEQYRAQGFDGSIILFGIPAVQHGMKVHIKSEIFKNMEGTFYIDKVVKKFRSSGYRQE